jgi:hypothetical protein
MSDSSITGAFQIKLPRELAVQVKRSAGAAPGKMRVEQWRGSWLTRLFEKLVGGKDS